MAKELKDYKDQVYAILKEHPQARNSDWTLMAHFIHKFRPELVTLTKDKYDLCVPLNKFKLFPSSETIIRARRLIQNEDGEFIPTDPEVLKARGIKEQNYRDAEVREAREHRVSYPD